MRMERMKVWKQRGKVERTGTGEWLAKREGEGGAQDDLGS